MIMYIVLTVLVFEVYRNFNEPCFFSADQCVMLHQQSCFRIKHSTCLLAFRHPLHSQLSQLISFENCFQRAEEFRFWNLTAVIVWLVCV